MKKLILLLFGLYVITNITQAQESYTAYKVSGSNIPVIDGTIEEIWSKVLLKPLLKSPDGAKNTVVPDNDSDFSAEWGMTWADSGMYFIFSITDDIVKIEDDYDGANSIPADQWWTDDNVNILFSSDLINESFEQWEFAYQYNIDQEEKLSSDDWLNPAEIDISLVETAWEQDGNTYILETFINWRSFKSEITPGQDIYLEMRARDDDDGGDWESMFQWSTDHYDIEKDGVGFGTVTLSTENLVGISSVFSNNSIANIYPNPANESIQIKCSFEQPVKANINIYDIYGKHIAEVASNMVIKDQVISHNINNFSPGHYIIAIESQKGTERLKFLKF